MVPSFLVTNPIKKYLTWSILKLFSMKKCNRDE